MITKKLKYILIAAFVVVFANISFSMGNGQGDPCDQPNKPIWCPAIPIDGGLSYIIIAGLAIGGKKVYDLNKK